MGSMIVLTVVTVAMHKYMISITEVCRFVNIIYAPHTFSRGSFMSRATDYTVTQL